MASESDAVNPFTDYRLMVEFQLGEAVHKMAASWFIQHKKV